MLKQLKKVWPKRPAKAPKPRPLEDIIWDRLTAPALGMLGFTSLIVIVMAIDHYNHQEGAEYFAHFVNLFHEWQSLIGGGYAILAAIFAGRVLVLQIARAEEMEQTRLKSAADLDERNSTRALKAARSVMPLSLSVLTDYTTSIAKAAIFVLDRSKLTREEMPALPAMPQSIIEDLQAFILAAPDAIGDNVADILSDLQLLSVNAESTWERTISKDEGQIVMPSNYEGLVGRAAVLHARLSALFPYARRETDDAPGAPVEEKVAMALQQWMVFSDLYPGCHHAAAWALRKATSPAS